MEPTVLLTSCLFQNTPGVHHGLLAAAGLRVSVCRGPLPESEMIAALGGYDGLLCDNDDITETVLAAACPRLKVISKVGASTTTIDADACARWGVDVFTTTGINHHAVAELTLGLMLSLCRRIPASSAALRDGRWQRKLGHELRGRRLGVVGLGRIGQEVARLARCFGMEVAAVAPKWPEEFASAHGIIRSGGLLELAARSDVLTLHPALTPETREMIHAGVLAAMPPGGLLVNTSRAGLIDHAAVLAALDSGHLGGFASDVPVGEPPDRDDLLVRHPQALITPHLGSFTVESIPRLLENAAENLIAALRGPA